MLANVSRFVSRRRRWLAALLAVPVALAAACWWLTEPLADPGVTSPLAIARGEPEAPKPAPEVNGPPTWPIGRLEGRAAKERLLDILKVAADRLARIEGYTATFRKRERIKGELRPEQSLAMKVRHKPFAVYFKFLAPQAGKEVVYAEGHHDNKMIAHGGGVSRLLVPRLAVAPDHPLALADARHPITEVGLSNLTNKLIRFREMDLKDDDAVTILDRTADSEGRPRLRSIHLHTVQNDDRPFARVEVLYDPETFFPIEISSYEWAEPGQLENLPLAEHYRYDDLDLDADLSSLDFDPANPAYAFHRY